MTPILETKDLECSFWISTGLFSAKKALVAVNGVSVQLFKGQVLGLVGESGCGKSTLAKMLLGLQKPTKGSIFFDGRPLEEMSQFDRAARVQPIFQDPYSSLNPRKTVVDIITLPLRVHKIGKSRDWLLKAQQMMDLCGLSRRYLNSYPNQLSGGQRQRVAIARALVMKPEVVICDEPTSALDVSVQSQILNLLMDLKNELGLTYLLISHNLAVVEHLADCVAVMYFGDIVENENTDRLFSQPKHEYTRSLLNSVLIPDPSRFLPNKQKAYE
ncbi:ATP-binding cassette domain-containing protein [Alphaproteobacteria bacterium]|jgi:peptide/nickel transport system ATP-binding protein|nr:ABC transporter ATP-binding protein [Rhodospirillaceae bacterium]MBT6305613.1 ABC transporter ATP-binding protein [Rhodospirillaceae bacterium]MBT7732821.1 ABC transporter ATP-binding protein [Rhodospirillaceae bacterium]MDC0998360.1 ATP-binding cassette domain-containing protein [Alphaproteobacteria bacterium]MDG1887579.1 ATP-binding cassette domain-containing protein [Alphaproteobacteria bacterium]